jgi:hypothetical protein
MGNTVVSTLKALGWLLLVIGGAVFVWFLGAAISANTVASARVLVALLAFGALVAGGVLWAVLLALSFALDALFDMRDRL